MAEQFSCRSQGQLDYLRLLLYEIVVGFEIQPSFINIKVYSFSDFVAIFLDVIGNIWSYKNRICYVSCSLMLTQCVLRMKLAISYFLEVMIATVR